ncbi:IPT/TIG domain-containing protein [Dactylosporangium sp. CA-233914]|uniref:IPT/TIG domain-containing protein n=1 Tax=Dactylosporangium sp. CA-233914 TaxID=3239934 RepID=UPI003D8C4642
MFATTNIRRGPASRGRTWAGTALALALTAATVAVATPAYAAVPTVTDVSPAAGPLAGGTEVTITGTNLAGATGVTFDGTAGTNPTVVSATSLKVTTPAHAAGNAAIVVTTTSDGSSDGTLEYTYVAAPTVTAVSPADGPVAGGTEVTITGTDLTGATKVTFDGTAGTGLTVVSATSLKVTTPAHAAGDAPIVVTAPGGTSNNTEEFAYQAAPAVTTQPLAQSRSVGATASFTAAASGYPAPTVKWQEKLLGGSWTDINAQTNTTLSFAATAQQNGAQYRAVFQNSLGSATTGPATLTVTPAPGTAPNAPAAPTVTAGVSSIAVTWTAPTENGSPVTGYTVTANPGPATCSTTAKTEVSCVLGANAGVSYTVTVVAHSAAGDSAASSASSPVTPTAPTTPATAPTADASLTTDAGPINAAEPGQQITIEGSGYAPYSTVIIALYSNPIQLGSVITDGSGDFTQTVTIPSDLDATSHALVAAGVAPGGTARNLRLDLYVAPGATTKMSGPIVRNGDSRPQMFARGADNNLYTSVQAVDGTWSAWTNLGGLIYSEPVAVLDNNGRLQVFVVGGDHSIWYRLQKSDGSFAWWVPVGSPKYLHSLALTQNDDGTVVIMGRGQDDNLWSIKQSSTSDPGSWTAWENLSGLIYSNPTLFKREDGLIEVFAIGGDGQIWHRVQTTKNTNNFEWWSRVGMSVTNRIGL